MDTILEYAKQHLTYELDNGKLLWLRIPKMCNGKRYAIGSEVGSIHNSGYRVLTLMGKKLQAHRVIWAIHYNSWPNGEIDHIDGDRLNNKLSNLRVVTRSQNMFNAKTKQNSSSGIKNVQWDNSSQSWRVRVRVNGKRYHVGRFTEIEKAAEAAKEFMLKSHKQYARV